MPVTILDAERHLQSQISTVFAIPEAEEFLPRCYHGDWSYGKHSNYDKSFVLDQGSFFPKLCHEVPQDTGNSYGECRWLVAHLNSLSVQVMKSRPS